MSLLGNFKVERALDAGALGKPALTQGSANIKYLQLTTMKARQVTSLDDELVRNQEVILRIRG